MGKHAKPPVGKRGKENKGERELCEDAFDDSPDVRGRNGRSALMEKAAHARTDRGYLKGGI